MTGYQLPSHDHDCSYLPGLHARTEHFVLQNPTDRVLVSLLEAGLRHFGEYYFRPVCPVCNRCIPIRIPLDRFVLSKSERRLIRKNADLSVTTGRDEPTEESYLLYLAHKRRFRGDSEPEDFQTYAKSFYSDHSQRRTVSSYEDRRLVARMHLDLTCAAGSAVYCYYDDTLHTRSLGTYSILRSIELARESGASHLYLGYYIRENRSMRYKSRFYPNQILARGRWVEMTDERGVEVLPFDLSEIERTGLQTPDRSGAEPSR